MLKSEIYIKTNGGSAVRVFPRYGSDVEVAIERADNERYYRKAIDGKFTFVGVDFDTIYNASLDTEFTLQIYMKDVLSGASTLYGESVFHKSDCTFNVDDKLCEIKFVSQDEYTKVIDSLEDEFNLINLAPERKNITLRKRAILQLYVKGDTKITHVVGNSSYEVDTNPSVDVTTLTDSVLQNTYKFGKASDEEMAYTMVLDANDLPYDLRYLAGIYIGQSWGQYKMLRTDGQYYVQVYRWRTGVIIQHDYCQYRFYNADGSYIHAPGQASPILTPREEGLVPTRLASGTKFYYQADQQYHELFEVSSVTNSGLFARILTDSSQGTTAVPDTDLSENNLNYNYVLPVDKAWLVDVGGKYKISFEVQDEVTKWGVNGEGKYFVQPNPESTGDNVIPVSYNMWIPGSFWLNSTPLLSDKIDRYSVDWQLKDAIPLWSAIKVLLAKIDSNIEFSNTTEYSQFLFGSENPISRQLMNLFITPVSNVKKTYYSEAAKKGTIKLSDITDMLKKCFQCYWFLEKNTNTGKWRFRIEHVSWFKNGKTYNSGESQTILEDLTQKINPHNSKPWSFGQSEFDYDAGKLPKRYEFGWSDEESDAFNGYAIDINNKFVGGSKEDNSVNNFISDLDFIIATPDSVTDDAFALICTGPQGAERTSIATVALGGVSSGNPILKLQNGELSFLNLEQVFWPYDLSGPNATIEGNVLSVIGTQNVKIQEGVEFPGDISLFSLNGLIKTSLGNGDIKKISLNLSSMIAKATLEYKTE